MSRDLQVFAPRAASADEIAELARGSGCVVEPDPGGWWFVVTNSAAPGDRFFVAEPDADWPEYLPRWSRTPCLTLVQTPRSRRATSCNYLPVSRTRGPSWSTPRARWPTPWVAPSLIPPMSGWCGRSGSP